MRGTDHASHPLAFFTRRAWSGVFLPLLPMIVLTVYVGTAVMHSDAGLVCLGIMFAVFLAIIALVGTMCAGLVGVLAGLGTYIFACGLIVFFGTFCCSLR